MIVRYKAEKNMFDNDIQIYLNNIQNDLLQFFFIFFERKVWKFE